MRSTTTLSTLLLAGIASAQTPGSYLFSTLQTEQTLSGSGGTVLQTLYPNEIHQFVIDGSSCATNSAEKWLPRSGLMAMAGDADGDADFGDLGLYGQIDALVVQCSPAGLPYSNALTTYFSPATPLPNCVSGANTLRPGDVGNVVDGQVTYYITKEMILSTLNLPLTAPLNVDAFAADPQFGVFFSLEDDIFAFPTCGGGLIQDGAIIMIPSQTITWTGGDCRVGAVTPGSAIILYDEPAVDAMVTNANVADAVGMIQNQIGDTDALDIDLFGPRTMVPTCYGVPAWIPTLLFAGENLTGAGVLTTTGGGTIKVENCGPLASGFLTTGIQWGLQPGTVGSLNGLVATRACRFAMEAVSHDVDHGFPFELDIASPGPFTWIAMGFAGPACSAPVSLPFAPGFVPVTHCFPHIYPNIFTFGVVGNENTGTGYGSWNSLLDPGFFVAPPAAWGPLQLLFQAVTINFGVLELSNPVIIDVPN